MKFQQTAIHATGAVLVYSGIALFAPAVIAAGDEAATTAPSSAAKFRQLDANHDGYISRGEVQQFGGYAKAFDEADDNHDGKLDSNEFIKAEAIYGRMKAAAYVDDSVITAKVKAALLKESKLNSLDVGVETYHGQVLLSGFVDDEMQRRKAMQTAASVGGVVAVKDGLAVK
jgi:hyperosmotically inducible periplasmic protein